MRGVKTKELMAVVDFIYHGEVNVYQNDLKDFLLIAEELELKGLAAFDSKEAEHYHKQFAFKTKPIKVNTTGTKFEENAVKNESTNPESKTISIVDECHATEDKLSLSFKYDNSELNEIINSMLERVSGIWTCTKCGKTARDTTNLKKHIETHIEGLSHPCGYCGKTFGSRNGLQTHVSRNH